MTDPPSRAGIEPPARATQPTPRWVAVLVLSSATAIWGASFVVAKGLVDDYDPMSVLGLRFAIGTAVLWTLRPGAVRALASVDRWHAAVIGLLLGAAQVPHYFGVRESTAAAAAFLIGTYVVATPVVDRLLYGVRTTRTATTGAVLALLALALFASGGTVSAVGLVLCLSAAVLYAVQISAVAAWVPPANLWGFTTVTMAAITVVVAVPAVARGLEAPSSPPDWLRLLYLALVAGVAAVAMQAWSQRRIPATQAAVILVMEPVWATGLAVALTTERLSGQLVLGGAGLLAANIVVALGSRRGAPAPASPPT
jgi:drug/metabolite transporter (DMT)-like permease